MDFVLNNLQGFICHKIQTTYQQFRTVNLSGKKTFIERPTNVFSKDSRFVL